MRRHDNGVVTWVSRFTFLGFNLLQVLFQLVLEFPVRETFTWPALLLVFTLKVAWPVFSIHSLDRSQEALSMFVCVCNFHYFWVIYFYVMLS